MTDDAVAALERAARIIAAGSAGLEVMRGLMPEYVRGAEFVYKLAGETIQNEIDYINKQRAARVA
jgi:hypothetical protein